MREYFDKIYKKSSQEFMATLQRCIEQEKKCCVVTANPEIFMLADQTREMQSVLLDRRSIVVPDGIGIILGGRQLGYHFEERIPGVDICSGLLKYADRHGSKLFLFGAKDEVVKTLVHKIKRRYPGLRICGYENGYVPDKDQVFDIIREQEPDIVMVALGAPIQELLIHRHLERFDKGVFIGVGGSFDVLSGCKKRAPQFFVKWNLEWLYRIATEPKRLKRFWNNNIKFLFAVRKERVKR